MPCPQVPAGFDGSAELPGAALGSRAEAEATLPHVYLLRFLQLRGQARKTPGMPGFGVHDLSELSVRHRSIHCTIRTCGMRSWGALSIEFSVCLWFVHGQ